MPKKVPKGDDSHVTECQKLSLVISVLKHIYIYILTVLRFERLILTVMTCIYLDHADTDRKLLIFLSGPRGGAKRNKHLKVSITV